jgi:electron transport complex protein RnfB
VVPLSPAFGTEGPRKLMFVDEARCIGCTLCIKACPVDCIVGAPRRMHVVIEPLCTGCERCLPACPVDCIEVETATFGRSGWAAWSDDDAERSRRRYAAHRERLARDEALQAPAVPPPDARQATVEAALKRARERAAAAARRT